MMVRRTKLIEWRPKRGVPLSPSEVTGLQQAIRSLTITPALEQPGCYDLTPGSHVGLVRLHDHEFEIRPKIGIDRLLFLISYAMDPSAWRDQQVHFGHQRSIVEAIIPGFAHQVDRALRPGVLQGYRTEEAAETTVRGRVRFEDQLRRRYGRPYPIEVRYDDFTLDIEINRLLKAAIHRLGRIPIRRLQARDRLHHFYSALADVRFVEYDPRHLPEIQFTRLNERYRPAVALAKLILQWTSFELEDGQVVSSSFLMDMNDVFEGFVVVALREVLGLSEWSFPQGARDKSLYLDTDQVVGLEPDISWWDGRRCLFVGDVKYKRTGATGAKNPDIYQLLSYTVGADLAEGLLIYAAGEARDWRYDVPGADKGLEVTTLDPGGEPTDILARVGRIAERIREMARVRRNGHARLVS